MCQVQEAALATLYIYLFIQFTKDSINERTTRKALVLLLVAEFMVLSTDILLCILLYLKYYLPRQMIQTWIALLKLQVEFVILNSLQKFSQRHANRVDLPVWRDDNDAGLPEFITMPDAVENSGVAVVRQDVVEKA